jgi:hypothetical protein
MSLGTQIEGDFGRFRSPSTVTRGYLTILLHFLKFLRGDVIGGPRSRPLLRFSQQSSGALS